MDLGKSCNPDNECVRLNTKLTNGVDIYQRASYFPALCVQMCVENPECTHWLIDGNTCTHKTLTEAPVEQTNEQQAFYGLRNCVPMHTFSTIDFYKSFTYISNPTSGSDFSDKSYYEANGEITQIYIYDYSNYIRGIRVQYGGVWGPVRGYAISASTVTLSAGESIDRFAINHGTAHIRGLKFYKTGASSFTYSYGMTITGTIVNEEVDAGDGCFLAYISGRATTSYIYKITFNFRCKHDF